MTRPLLLLTLFIAASLSVLTACGDDGLAPFARAGDDQVVNLGEVVQLDGTASSDNDNDTLTYTWSLTSVPEGSAATLTNQTTATPTFTPDLIGEYVAEVEVYDGDWATSDSVTVVVLPTEAVPADNVDVLVIHSIDTIHGWQVDELLSDAATIVQVEYPSLVDEWNAGTIEASIITVEIADAYHPERFWIDNWTVSKL